MKVKNLPLLANLLLAGLTAFSATNFVETFLYYDPGKIPGVEGPKDKRPFSRPAPEKAASAEDCRLITQRDIFGAGKVASETKGKAAETVIPTSLALVLKGTVLGENQASYAIIANAKTHIQETYGLNEFVQGGRVVDILKDKVVLSVNGKREVLEMEAQAGWQADKEMGKNQRQRPAPKGQGPRSIPPSPRGRAAR